MIRASALAALALATACTSSGLTDDPTALGAGAVIDGEFIISEDLDDSALADFDLVKLDYDADLQAGLYLAQEGIDRGTLEATLKQRLRGSLVVENNRPSTLLANDPMRRKQWNMDMLDIEQAWSYSKGRGVRVAVIDTGVAAFGQDTPKNLINGWDYVDNDGNPRDEHGHGTHVAGTVAQASNNNRGTIGVAPDVELLAIRVLDRWGSGSSYWTAKGITYAVNNGADVINLSLGSPSSTSVERDAVRDAVNRGVVVVAASGNEGRNSLSYPAAYPDVIAVGAVNAKGFVTSYSNGGQGLDVVAPGGVMWQDKTGDGNPDGILQETIRSNGGGTHYEYMEGTSMASPHVAGVAALLIGAGAKPGKVRNLIVNNADEVNANGWDRRSGWGLVNPVASLRAMGATAGGGNNNGGGSNNGGGGNNNNGDTTAPVVSNVAATRTSNTLTLYWTTNEPAGTQVDFEDFGMFGEPNPRTRDHEMAFTIDWGTTYYFTIVAKDAAGNVRRDGLWVSYP